jgi:hypothetical protein
MSELSDMAALLAVLPDEDLLSVVMAATTGRPGLEPLHLVAVELSAHAGHVPPGLDVTSPTSPVPGVVGGAPATLPDQVGPGVGLPIPPAGVSGVGGYLDSGVPTFESVRDKVERRFGTAQGMGELDSQTPAGRGVQEQWQARAKSARERLDEIRKSMRRSDSDGSGGPGEN